MSRTTRITIFTIAILLLWWLSGTWLSSRVETGIQKAVSNALSEERKDKEGIAILENGKPSLQRQVRFEGVNTELKGQDLYLNGSVRSPKDRNEVEELMRGIKVPLQPWPFFSSTHLNSFSPLNNVYNNLKVVSASGEALPAWASIASQHGKPVLSGEYPDEATRQELATAVAATWPETKDRLSMFRVDDAAQSSGEKSVSISTVPAKPAEKDLQNGWFALGLLGKPWEMFTAEETEADAKKKAEAAGVPWNLVANQRFLLAQGQKPAAYAALSAVNNTVRLEGEVGESATKQELTEAAQKAYPGATVTNNVVVSTKCRHSDGVGATGTTFPAMPALGAAAVVGLAQVGEKWASQATTPAVVDDLAGFSKPLLGSLKAEIAQPSVDKLLTALYPPLAPYAVLALTDKKAQITGQVKDEAGKLALTEAAKKAYPNSEIVNQITVNPRCSAVANLAPTATSFPAAPAAGGNPWLAVASLGNPWSSGPRDGAQAENAMTAVSGLATYNIPPVELNAAVATVLPTLKESLAAIKSAVPPAPPATPAAPAMDPAKFVNGGVEEPLLSLFGENKKLSVSGEISDDASKAKLMESLKAHFQGWEIQDELVVSKFVKPVADLAPTLSKLTELPTDGARFTSTARIGEAPRKATIHSIYFATGKFEWSRDRERALAQAKRVLALAPTAKIEISGHTDNVGSEASNTALSLKRAEMLRDYFVEQGVAKDQVLTRGAGPKEPLGDNANDVGRSKNRRVDLVVK